MNDGKPQWAAAKVDDVAAFLGQKRRSVDGYLAQGCPGKSGGWYDLKAIVAWCRENVWVGKDSSKKSELELQKLEHDVARSRMNLLRDAGALVDRNAAKAAQSQAFNMLRAKLQELSDRIAATVPADIRADVQRSVSHEIEVSLREMSQISDIDAIEGSE